MALVPCPLLATHLLGDRELEVEAAIRGPGVPRPAAFDNRFGGVENLHLGVTCHLALSPCMELVLIGVFPSARYVADLQGLMVRGHRGERGRRLRPAGDSPR
jgi:hypothetical protein